MVPIRFRSQGFVAAVLLAISVPTTPLLARVPAPIDARHPLATAHLISVGLFLVPGPGGNALIRLTAAGPIVVDACRSGTYKAFRKKTRRFSEDSASYLIGTRWLDDCTASYEAFAAAGAQIVAQQDAWSRQVAGNADLEQQVAAITFGHEYTVQQGGVTVELMHFGPARTRGDSVVYFPGKKVVAVGDLYAPAPIPDYSAGGSLVGWGVALDELLKLDFDLAVPSHGPVVDRTAIVALKGKIERLVSRSDALVKSGVPEGQLPRRLDAERTWHPPFDDKQLGRFYAEILASLGQEAPSTHGTDARVDP